MFVMIEAGTAVDAVVVVVAVAAVGGGGDREGKGDESEGDGLLHGAWPPAMKTRPRAHG
jgi:hypothetical protein